MPHALRFAWALDFGFFGNPNQAIAARNVGGEDSHLVSRYVTEKGEQGLPSVRPAQTEPAVAIHVESSRPIAELSR